jgi:hypothetical protein
VKTKTVLKWTNRFSGEEGFVKSVLPSRGYFVNTFDVVDAKAYKGPKDIMNDLELLRKFGEFDNNMFTSEVVNY